MNRDEKEEITDQLRDILSSSLGMPVVFSLAECVKEYLEQPRFSEKNKSVPEPDVFEIEESVPKFAQKLSSIQCPAITTGDCIEDRKSVFQGHFAHVETFRDVLGQLESFTHDAYKVNCTDMEHRYYLPNNADIPGPIFMYKHV